MTNVVYFRFLPDPLGIVLCRDKLESVGLARQRHRFPRGVVLRAANQNLSIASGNRTLIRKAVAQIGTSEPIWVTDEERRPASTRCAVR